MDRISALKYRKLRIFSILMLVDWTLAGSSSDAIWRSPSVITGATRMRRISSRSQRGFCSSAKKPRVWSMKWKRACVQGGTPLRAVKA